MEVYRQLITINVVWMRPSGESPHIGLQGELAQALNGAGGQRGVLWNMELDDIERLKGIENIE